MKLVLIIGPMFSGKTTYIIENFNPINTLAIKQIIDNRYKTKEITSHNKCSIPCVSIKKLMNLKSKIDFNEFENIMIDEGQFFDDLNEFINFMEKYQINIYVAALNGDFNRKPFKQINNLYSRADEIIYKQGKCNFCEKKSSFSWKMDQYVNSSQIDVGGNNKYQPVCGNCYQDFLKKSSSRKFSLG